MWRNASQFRDSGFVAIGPADGDARNDDNYFAR
jgi:hypothetical protein